MALRCDYIKVERHRKEKWSLHFTALSVSLRLLVIRTGNVLHFGRYIVNTRIYTYQREHPSTIPCITW